jgi:pullulanase/glycogen debranching enzyme
VDLGDETLQPDGWETVKKPPLAAPEDIVIYELHIRDFSIGDQTVPEELRGTYKAFTIKDSNGMKHLAGLAGAGLTHIHLLPAFDIASVNEDKSTWQTVDEAELASLPPDADEQSMAVSAITASDGFNWGYDPLHYTTPEGSYATDPSGTPRIVEFRQMVQSLNESGLRVVMDVVYNHTNASGQSENSVLDRVLPGYYHRLNAEGAVEKSTC